MENTKVPIFPSCQSCCGRESDPLNDNAPTSKQMLGRAFQWLGGSSFIVGGFVACTGFGLEHNGPHYNASAHGIQVDRWLEFAGSGVMAFGGVLFMLGTAMVEQSGKSVEIYIDYDSNYQVDETPI